MAYQVLSSVRVLVVEKHRLPPLGLHHQVPSALQKELRLPTVSRKLQVLEHLPLASREG